MIKAEFNRQVYIKSGPSKRYLSGQAGNKIWWSMGDDPENGICFTEAAAREMYQTLNASPVYSGDVGIRSLSGSPVITMN